MQLGQYPAPGHVVAHVSDPHLLAGDARQYGVIHPEAGLRLALERLTRLDPAPQALVFTGDLADRAEPAAYDRLRELVEPVAEALSATVVWVMGNHDERAEYAKSLFGEADESPQDRVHDVAGLRIVALDTTVPGYHHGGFSDAQYAWLTRELATPAPHGTVLVIHHAPITYRSPVMQLLDFDDVDRLRAAVAGTDVRAVLSGHLHVTPATAILPQFASEGPQRSL